jgi:hypothetical protein
MPRKSKQIPASHTAEPVAECPPPYTDSGRLWATASLTTADTSSAVPQRAIRVGEWSKMALKVWRASS